MLDPDRAEGVPVPRGGGVLVRQHLPQPAEFLLAHGGVIGQGQHLAGDRVQVERVRGGVGVGLPQPVQQSRRGLPLLVLRAGRHARTVGVHQGVVDEADRRDRVQAGRAHRRRMHRGADHRGVLGGADGVVRFQLHHPAHHRRQVERPLGQCRVRLPQLVQQHQRGVPGGVLLGLLVLAVQRHEQRVVGVRLRGVVR